MSRPSQLTRDDLIDIAFRVATGNETRDQIASDYGVSAKYITMMVNGERNAEFGKILVNVRESLHQQAITKIAGKASEAIDALCQCMASEKGASKVKAAEVLLKHAFPQEGTSVTVNNGPQLPADKVKAFLDHTAESEGGPNEG